MFMGLRQDQPGSKANLLLSFTTNLAECRGFSRPHEQSIIVRVVFQINGSLFEVLGRCWRSRVRLPSQACWQWHGTPFVEKKQMVCWRMSRALVAVSIPCTSWDSFTQSVVLIYHLNSTIWWPAGSLSWSGASIMSPTAHEALTRLKDIVLTYHRR